MTSSKSPPSLRQIDEPRLEALVETMFLAAFADGEIGDEERHEFSAEVESLTDRKLGAQALEALVTRFAAELEAQGRPARVAAVKARLGSPATRKLALELALRIVASDGIIRTTERELILDLAVGLDIDRDEAADLVAKLNP